MHLLRKPDVSGIYLNVNPEISKELFDSLQQRFGTFRNLSNEVSIDESNLRKWRRNGKVPISAVKRLLKHPETMGIMPKLTANIKYLSVQSSPHRVFIPNLTPELAYVVGYVSGDGHLKPPKGGKWEIIAESWTDKKILESVNLIIKKCFGIVGSLNKNVNRKGWRLFINSRIVHIFLNELFEIPVGKKSDKVNVPRVIRNASDAIRKSYLRGWFDAEGFVTRSHGRKQIEFFVNNKRVSKWVSNQLSGFGVKNNKNKRGTVIIYSRNIRKFSEQVGFNHDKQVRKLLQTR